MFDPNNPEEVKKVIKKLVEFDLLRGVDLRQANLERAKLIGANLRGALITPSQLKEFYIVVE